MQNFMKTILSGIKAWTKKEIEKNIQPSDWNQNDCSAADYVKNRTHWEELTFGTLVDNLTYEDYDNGNYPGCTFVVGQKYDVTWNGKLYSQLECVEDGGWRVLGDSSKLPFYIDDDGGDDLYAESNVGDNNWTLTIIGCSAIVHTIDPKYLPEEIYETFDELHSGLDEAFNDINSVRTSAEAAQNAADNAQMDADTNAEKLMTSYIANTTLPSSEYTWTKPVYADGKFVICGTSDSGTSNKAAYSLDGIKWVETELPEYHRWNSPMYGNGKFVALTGESGTIAAYSEDGINWNKTDVPQGNYSVRKYGGGVFVGLQTNGSAFVYSTDGVTWSRGSLPQSGSLSQLLYVDGKFVVICCKTSGTCYALYSLDGKEWNQVRLPVNKLDRLMYSNGIFLAYYSSHSATSAAYSFDGINWTRTTLPVSMWCGDIVYANGTFVMNALGSASDIAAYSFDGINWTKTTLPLSQNWSNIVYGNDVFVAFPSSASDTSAYSFDGINWTKTTLPVSQNWQNLVYHNGVFIAFPSVVSDIAAYSLDGINWTQTTLPVAQVWKNMVYGNGVFVALPDSEGGSIAAYSFDGINWKTEYTAIFQNNTDVTGDIRKILEIPTTEEITSLIDEKVGENGADIDVVAAPGQMLIVKAVDENGKPTEWEAADRTHYDGISYVLPEYKTAYNEDDVQFLINKSVEVEAGKEYIVNWNGVTYQCIAKQFDLEGVSCCVLGDVGAMIGEVSTGEPFCILVIPIYAIEAVGFGVAGMPLDGSTDITLSIATEEVKKLDNKYLDLEWLPTSQVEKIEILPTTQIEDDNITTIPSSVITSLIEADTVYVKMSATEFETVVRARGDDDGVPYVWIGNMHIADEQHQDTGEEYLIVVRPGNLTVIGYGDDRYGGTIAISIDGRSVNKIPEKYLPNCVVKTVNGISPDEDGNVEINIPDASQNANVVEPAEDDIPKVFFGGALQQTKDEAVVPFRYISKTDDFSGYAEIKGQGNSSMSYPKKNQTVKMFKDAECTEKLKVDFKGWGKQNKHVYKANWIDLSHARNVVSARLWADVVKSRANYATLPELLRTTPNQGAVDGFSVKVYAAGVYQGRYTLNIPKDKWTFNMDDDLEEHCVLCGENYVSGCFRASAKIDESDWTDEIHDTVPASIKTRWNEVISFVMNSTDEEFKANLSQYFYVDSLIDYDLFGLASCGLDAFGKNQIYATYDGQRWIASMYDMDSTWGLYWNGSKFVSASYGRNEFEDMVQGRQGNLLYMRLEQLFGAELQTRWEELKNGALSIENIINRFERFTDIAPAELVKEDYASTTGGGKFTGIPSKDTNNIQQIRSFALARQTWTDNYVSALTGRGAQPEQPENPDPADVPCTGITVDKSAMTFTAEGMQNLTANVTPEGCTDVVTWETSDPSVAVVSDGVVYAVGNGNATITARCGGFIATCAVSVSGIVVDETMVYRLPTPTTFDGTTTFVDTGIQLFDTDKDFTLFLRFTNDVNPTQVSVFHCMNEESPWPGVNFQTGAGGEYLLSYYSSKANTNYNKEDKNTHAVVVRKTAGSNCIYVRSDGVEQIVDGGNFSAVTQNLLLGCYQTTDGTKGRFWKGTISECKVWNRALSRQEIEAFDVYSYAETYLRQNFSPNQESFMDTVDINFKNGDFIEAEIDLTNCSGTNECVLSIGDSISEFFNSFKVHSYYTANTGEFLIDAISGVKYCQHTENLENDILTLRMCAGCFVVNGEVIPAGSNNWSKDGYTYYINTVKQISAMTSVQVGSTEGTSRSNATYNYIKVCKRI